jgi:hypothetical protein
MRFSTSIFFLHKSTWSYIRFEFGFEFANIFDEIGHYEYSQATLRDGIVRKYIVHVLMLMLIMRILLLRFSSP